MAKTCANSLFIRGDIPIKKVFHCLDWLGVAVFENNWKVCNVQSGGRREDYVIGKCTNGQG